MQPDFSAFPLRTLLSLMALGLLTACVPREVSRFIGKNPRLVFGDPYLVDQTTMQFDESKPGVDWGMTLAWQGDHYVITADQNTTPNQPTQVWQIVAVQDIPLLIAGQMLAMGTCMDDGVRNSRVVAIVDYDEDKQWFDHIEGAWAYDYGKDAFEPYPTAKLLCYNPRYGLGLDAPKPLSETPLPVTPAPAAITQSPPR